MKQLYNITALAYAVILLLFIPFSFLAQILVGAAGHVRSFNFWDYFALGYAGITAVFLLRSRVKMQNGFRVSGPSLYVLTLLLIVGIAAAFEPLWDNFQDGGTFNDLDGASIGIITMVFSVNLILLLGLWDKRSVAECDKISVQRIKSDIRCSA